MESSLHQELKRLFAGQDGQLEVSLGDFRIDAVCGSELVEIQLGSLAAIRRKVERLLAKPHHVRVVKPLIVRKKLVKRNRRGGRVVGRRLSPKQGRLLDLFDELVYFTRVFPHPRLVLEVPLLDIEEWRYPGHGRRRRWRKTDHVVEDQKLLAIRDCHCLRTADDLAALLPSDLPAPFHTGHIAESLGIPRWTAQRIAYCLRNTGGACEVGKQGNARLYRFAA